MHIAETANNVFHIFDSDRERTPYLKQTGKEHHIKSHVTGFEPLQAQNIGL